MNESQSTGPEAEAVGAANPKTAPAPFDDLNADLVLRSVDKVDFYVYRSVLQLSSSVFASMLSFPQPPSQEISGCSAAAHNVVDLPDDSDLLYKLLSWVDPRGALHFSDLQDAADILILAQKYDSETVKGRLLAFVCAGREDYKQNPVALFALGRRFNHKEIADFGAKESLRFPVTERSDTPLLDLITGRDHQALMLYFFHCQRVAKSVVKDWLQWIGTNEFVWRTGWGLHHCSFKPSGGSNYPDWWVQYLDRIARALWETPSLHALSSIEIFSVTTPAASCSKCKTVYVQDLQSFNLKLTERLDMMIPR